MLTLQTPEAKLFHAQLVKDFFDGNYAEEYRAFLEDALAEAIEEENDELADQIQTSLNAKFTTLFYDTFLDQLFVELFKAGRIELLRI